MKVLEKIDFVDAPEFIQDQIYRELYDEDERTPSPALVRGEMVLELIEYDPFNLADHEILIDHLNQKISDEGEPDWDSVDEIGNSGCINDPILITTGICREGRHRLAAALKFGLLIKAYVY
jgi:hypothetical protein